MIPSIRIIFTSAFFLATSAGFAYADTLSGGGYTMQASLSPLSAESAPSGGSLTLNGVVMPFGTGASGGSFSLISSSVSSSPTPASPAPVTSSGGGGGPPAGGGSGWPVAFTRTATTTTQPQLMVRSLNITPSKNGATISISTNIATESDVRYGLAPTLSATTSRRSSATEHVFIIAGLLPDRLYNTQIRLYYGAITTSLATLQFNTVGSASAKNIKSSNVVSTTVSVSKNVSATKTATTTRPKNPPAAPKTVTITGIVQDTHGAVVGNAEITVFRISTSTGERVLLSGDSPIQTAGSGQYAFGALLGTFVIRVSKDGYVNAESAPIDTANKDVVTSNFIISPIEKSAAPLNQPPVKSESFMTKTLHSVLSFFGFK